MLLLFFCFIGVWFEWSWRERKEDFESLVSKLDNDAAGEYRPSNCQLAGYGCIIKQPFEAGEC